MLSDGCKPVLGTGRGSGPMFATIAGASMATTRSILVLLVLVAVAVGVAVGLLVGLLQLAASAA